MAKSTFAGKSTDDTIRNYAEMLIDDLNSNFHENAFNQWDKAREMDNKTAKKIFGEEYSDRIGEAFSNCITKYQIPELKAVWEKSWETRKGIGPPPSAGAAAFSDAATSRYMANSRAWMDESKRVVAMAEEMVESKFKSIVGIINTGLSIAPQNADLNASAAWVYINQMSATDIPIGDKNQPRSEWQNKGGLYQISNQSKMEAMFAKIEPIVKDLVSRALDIQPNHPKALEAKEKIILLERAVSEVQRENAEYFAKKEKEAASGCFIATAAYGTPFSEEIDVLRNWRDDFLEASYPGRLFIRTYYSLSPPVADNISESDGKRKIVRTALGPIVKVLKDRYSN